MMKKTIIIILIFSLLLVSSCKQQATVDSTATFIGGTVGLSADFVTSNPPSEFKKSSSVPLKILIKNEGESQVATGNAKVKIFSPEPTQLGLSTAFKSNIGALMKKDSLTGTGGEQEIDFGKISYKPNVINQEPIILRARLCYDYMTDTVSNVCLKSRASAELNDGVCDITGQNIVRTGDVSSAPIQITSIIEQSAADQVNFAITVQNVGQGSVFSPSATCESLENDEQRGNEKDKMLLKITSPVNAQCDFKTGNPGKEGTISLINNAAIIKCWAPVEDTVEDKIKISLTYKYRDQITKSVTVLQG